MYMLFDPAMASSTNLLDKVVRVEEKSPGVAVSTLTRIYALRLSNTCKTRLKTSGIHNFLDESLCQEFHDKSARNENFHDESLAKDFHDDYHSGEQNFTVRGTNMTIYWMNEERSVHC